MAKNEVIASEIRIRDLYAGKPDAKDELYFDGADSFIKTFVLAEHFNIDALISGNHCFITGFKGTGKTANQLFKNTVLEFRFVQVLNDLYRLGFLGNFLPASKTYHWQHRGDPMLILSDEWRLCVHYALHSALSLGAKNDFGLNRGREPQAGDTANATVNDVIRSFALVDFKLYGVTYNGSIHIAEFGKLGYGFIKRLSDIIHDGDKFDVILEQYDEKYSRWILRLNNAENGQS